MALPHTYEGACKAWSGERSATLAGISGTLLGLMRQMLFLSVAGMRRFQTSEWSKLYQRLIQTKCPTDTITGEKKGNMPVIGRIAGQLIETMYALLKTDAEVLRQVLPGQEPPSPTLSDQEVRRRHREGHYQPVKPSPRPSRIVLLPNSP